MSNFTPGALFWQGLHAAESPRTDPAVPYPFFLASPLEGDPSQLGERADWQAEWKWDGIRGQLIRRAGECHLWSRGEERITGRFPEIVDAAGSLPDGVVLDGEVVAWKDGRVQPFALLQQRIGRKKLTKSGIALRFPRILRWRTDKPASEADTLANLQAMLSQV